MHLSSWILVLVSASVLTCTRISNAASDNAGSFSFKDSFDLTGAEDHFRTSPDGQVWYLSLDKKAG